MIYALAAALLTVQMIIAIMFNSQSILSQKTDIATIGDSMIIYDNYALAYASQNTSYSGTPTPAMIGLPTWFNVPKTSSGTATVNVYIQGGRAYTYYTGAVSGVPGYLAAKLQSGYITGTNKNGVLSSPTLPPSATATVTIPPSVPNGSTVLMP